MTGYAQSAKGNQQPDFSQGRPCRPVQTHDEAAGGGNWTCNARHVSDSRSQARSAPSARFGIVSTCRAESEELIGLPWLRGAKRRARSLALAADAGYRDCTCRGAEPEAKSHACKSTRASLPRELMPNPSLKRSANGRPPGPGWWYGVHFHQPRAGGMPLSPT